MRDIDEIKSIIDDGKGTRSWEEECANYLEAIAKTQLLIYKELREMKK